MKKSLKKSLAVVLASLMVATIAPISASAETLEVSEDTGLTTENYSFKLATGTDYITNELKDVPKNKTIVIDEGTANVSFSMDVVEFSWGNNATTPSYYCIGNDITWTCTSEDTSVTGTVTGFGAGKVSDAAYGYSYSSAISTGFSIDTSSFEAGKDYVFTISYKYQLKSKSRYTSWSTRHQIIDTLPITISVAENEVAEPDTTTTVNGTNIRVGDSAGLRFCFKTTEDVSTVQDYGFVYSKDDVENFVIGADGVYQKSAERSLYDDDNKVTNFNLVFTEVPSTSYDMTIYARSYVITSDGEVHYSDVVSNSFNVVAQMVLNDPTIDEQTKTALNELLAK
jgi:hypothetical protein